MKYNDDIEKRSNASITLDEVVSVYDLFVRFLKWSCTWRLLHSVKNSVGNFPVILL